MSLSVLKSLLSSQFSSDQLQSIQQGFTTQRRGSFRINTLKSSLQEVFEILATLNISVTQAPEPVSFAYTFDRKDEYALKGSVLFREGKIYLQSLASMLPVLALDIRRNFRVLDVCAAPGSKTTQIAALMGNTGKITALEKQKIRFDVLTHNIKLQGATGIECIYSDAKKWLASTSETFDRILLDVPCSGEGRIHFDRENTFERWSLDYVKYLSGIQSELLQASASRLAPGGSLVYSTCTLNTRENEGVINAFLAKNPEFSLQSISLQASNFISAYEGKAFRVLPDEDFEGFFVAKISRNEMTYFASAQI